MKKNLPTPADIDEVANKLTGTKFTNKSEINNWNFIEGIKKEIETIKNEIESATDEEKGIFHSRTYQTRSLTIAWNSIRLFETPELAFLLYGKDPDYQKPEFPLEELDYEKELLTDAEYSLVEKSQTPLDLFLNYVNSGSYPPPEVIQNVADVFNEYFSVKGNGGPAALEILFFGKPTPGLGNESAKRNNDRLYKRFYAYEKIFGSDKNTKDAIEEFLLLERHDEILRRFMIFSNTLKNKASLEEAARNFLAGHDLIKPAEITNFERSYDRWLGKNTPSSEK